MSDSDPSQNHNHNHEDEKKTDRKFEAALQKLLEMFADQSEITQLLKCLEKKYSKKKSELKKVKSKLKKSKTKKVKTEEVACQTEYVEPEIPWELEEDANIAEQVKEAAETALQETGMVYEPNSGLYYDYNSGYYYNGVLGLYYHSDTGCYYTFDKQTNEFTYHSHADINHFRITREHVKHIEKTEKTLKNKRKKEMKKERLREKRKREGGFESDDDRNSNDENLNDNGDKGKLGKYSSVSKSHYDREEGECSNHSPSDSWSDSSSDDEYLTDIYPPCIRMIIQETAAKDIKEGSLFIITKEGGTIGREGSDHALVIPELLISKSHLKIEYDEYKRHYYVTDIGSRNGTLLDGKTLPVATEKQKPIKFKISHGSIIQLGNTKILCHIHPGSQTCGHCEPGLLNKDEPNTENALKNPIVNLKKEHKKVLQALKSKYCVSNYVENEIPEGYEDRAQKRREKVGSLHEGEKTVQASLDVSISSTNKGFKMLQKMGWSTGKGLGKDTQGEKEPVPLVSNPGTSGLGSNMPMPIVPKNLKTTMWINTQKRYQQLKNPAPIFGEESEGEEEGSEQKS